jgi:hypothetical protein
MIFVEGRGPEGLLLFDSPPHRRRLVGGMRSSLLSISAPNVHRNIFIATQQQRIWLNLVPPAGGAIR